MTRGLLQKSSSTSKILYTCQFAPYTTAQLDSLSAALASPLRQQKTIGTRLATTVLITEELGGFLPDIHRLVQQAKLRLIKQAFKQGEATERAMQSLLARAARRGFVDLSLTSGRIVLRPEAS